MNEEQIRDMKPQTRQIYRHLMTGKGITSMTAWADYGITRLSARIWELRHEYAIKIKAEKKPVKTRFGETTAIVEYSMKEAEA